MSMVKLNCQGACLSQLISLTCFMIDLGIYITIINGIYKLFYQGIWNRIVTYTLMNMLHSKYSPPPRLLSYMWRFCSWRRLACL